MTASDDFSGTTPNLYLGTIRGVRAFSRDPNGCLTAISSHEHTWLPGENLARCPIRPLNRSHRPANPDCTCGFYAYHDDESDGYTTVAPITGVIDAYGSVTVGTLGFRAEKARIVALCIESGPSPALFQARVTGVISVFAALLTIHTGLTVSNTFLSSFLVTVATLLITVNVALELQRRRLRRRLRPYLNPCYAHARVPIYTSRRRMLAEHLYPYSQVTSEFT